MGASNHAVAGSGTGFGAAATVADPPPNVLPEVDSVPFGLIVMFCGLLTTHVLIFAGAAILVGSLYSWLCSPLEPEHH